MRIRPTSLTVSPSGRRGLLISVSVLFLGATVGGGGAATFATGALATAVGCSAGTVAKTANPGTTATHLEGVAALSASNAWATGYTTDSPNEQHGTSLIEHWNGSTWTREKSQNSGKSWNQLNGLSALGANSIWAVGAYFGDGKAYHPLVEYYDGTRWSTQSTDRLKGDSFLLDVSARSASDVWAAGYWDRAQGAALQTLIEHWNGTRWSIVPSPNVVSADNVLSGIVALGASDAWAVGRARRW